MKTVLQHGQYPEIPDKLNFMCTFCECVFTAEKEDWHAMAKGRGAYQETVIDIMTYCPECGQRTSVQILK